MVARTFLFFPLLYKIAPCKRSSIVDWRFPPYPGDEGSLWNDELKCVDLFLPLWKQFLLIFICLVQLSVSSSALHHSVWDGGGQLQLALKDAWQWQWGHAMDAKGDGWTFAALNSLCVCGHERGPAMSSFWFWQFPVVVWEITLGKTGWRTQSNWPEFFFFSFLLCRQN